MPYKLISLEQHLKGTPNAYWVLCLARPEHINMRKKWAIHTSKNRAYLVCHAKDAYAVSVPRGANDAYDIAWLNGLMLTTAGKEHLQIGHINRQLCVFDASQPKPALLAAFNRMSDLLDYLF